MNLNEAVLDVLGTEVRWWTSNEILKAVIRRELYFQKNGNVPTQSQVTKRLSREESKDTIDIDKSNVRRYLYRLKDI